MQVATFEQDNMYYTFEPPVEVGDARVGSIHELAAIALLGSEASEDEITAAMLSFTDALRVDYDRVGAFNAFLEGKHVVTGRQIRAGSQWRSDSPRRGKVPGAELSPARAEELLAELRGIDAAQMAVHGNDPIVY